MRLNRILRDYASQTALTQVLLSDPIVPELQPTLSSWLMIPVGLVLRLTGRTDSENPTRVVSPLVCRRGTV